MLSLKAVLVQEDLGSGVVVEREVGTIGMAGDLGAATLLLLVDNFNNKSHQRSSERIVNVVHRPSEVM